MNPSGQNRYWRKAFPGLLVGLFLALTCLFGASPGSAAPQFSAGDLIAAVNQLRQANGLAPYQVNPALMAAAQAHSEYQASIGQITHTGAGGSSATSRAIAAGYGGGAQVYVSENIAGGSSLTIQGAVQMWQGDSLHLGAMVSTSYQDAGAGIASAGGVTYYTLDVGYVAGGSSVASTPGSGTAKPVGASPATAAAFLPVVISTPGQDGSIIHVVQPGQTVWSIAATYGIELEELLLINNLPVGAWIFPGDKLLIKAPGSVPTATEIPTEPALESLRETPEESTATPTATRRPRGSTDPTAISLAVEDLYTDDPPVSDGRGLANDLIRSLGVTPLLVIAVLIVGGFVLILLGNVLKRSE